MDSKLGDNLFMQVCVLYGQFLLLFNGVLTTTYVTHRHVLKHESYNILKINMAVDKAVIYCVTMAQHLSGATEADNCVIYCHVITYRVSGATKNGTAVIYCSVMSQHLSGADEESRENPQPEC